VCVRVRLGSVSRLWARLSGCGTLQSKLPFLCQCLIGYGTPCPPRQGQGSDFHSQLEGCYLRDLESQRLQAPKCVRTLTNDWKVAYTLKWAHKRMKCHISTQALTNFWYVTCPLKWTHERLEYPKLAVKTGYGIFHFIESVRVRIGSLVRLWFCLCGYWAFQLFVSLWVGMWHSGCLWARLSAFVLSTRHLWAVEWIWQLPVVCQCLTGFDTQCPTCPPLELAYTTGTTHAHSDAHKQLESSITTQKLTND